METATPTPTAPARARGRRVWVIAAIGVLITGAVASAAGAILFLSSARRESRQQFDSAATNVSATLGTLIRRDADFVTTIRAVLTMEPQITNGRFTGWYNTFDGRSRQIGGLGTAVIALVPARRLSAFQAARDADPTYRAVVSHPRTVAATGRSSYCILKAAVATLPLDGSVSDLVQRDWCGSDSVLGRTQSTAFRQASETGQSVAMSTAALGIPTMLLEAAYYPREAPLQSAAQRVAAVRGWVLGTFDVNGLIAKALGQNHGLEVTLYHRNPGGGWFEVGRDGAPAAKGAFSHSSLMAIDGSWRVIARGRVAQGGLSPTLVCIALLGSCALATVLLALLLLVLSRSRERALGMVEEKTGELRHQALHDALTGLPNRVLALDRAEQMLARARRSGVAVSALYVDIDGFKAVNDTFGHAAGDVVLRSVADRLATTTRESDTAARLAGDEFVVLLDGAELQGGAQLVAARLLELLRERSDVGSAARRQLSITTSIGIAHGLDCTAEELLSNADVALYVAKTTGKNRYVVFEPGMETAAQDRLRLEIDLADALERGELFLAYQPTVELASGRAVGVEALLRWRHPTRGLLAPDAFIPIAEESGLIVSIGRWVLEEACRQAARWRQQGYSLGVSVNVSARQLDDALIGYVRSALTASDLPAEQLTLEITESTLVGDARATVQLLAAIKSLGVRVAIDDFGSGYSSLAYLRQFPVDTLKIDRTFVKGIAGSKQSAALMHTLVRLGKTLNLQTLAEGIEDPAQLRALKRQRCDHGQGFLFAHPLEPEALERFLAEQDEALAS